MTDANEKIELNEIEGQTLSRRWFLGAALATAAAGPAAAAATATVGQPDQEIVGPDPAATLRDRPITVDDVRTALAVAGIEFRESDLPMLAETIPNGRRQYIRRRENGPPEQPPASVFRVKGDPAEGNARHAGRGIVIPENAPPPGSVDDIVFAPAWHQASWLRQRIITSEQLTRFYLDRIDRLSPRLNNIITVMRDSALEQARRADREIAAGNIRGPLHGLPYGAKDLFDTAGVRTTYGAAPFRDRVPDKTAVIIDRLQEAGAVLLAKTSLGALAYGDIWFGGTCRNPFDPEQGSSGSSAGSASAASAGMFSFTIGTETLGSIVSPCMRCGSAGLRPTFGRVPRTNSMELCWSLDKVGPICRTIADTAMVLDAMNGADDGDPSSVDAPFDCDLTASVEGLRVGYIPGSLNPRNEEIDKPVFDACRDAGMELVELDFEAPRWTGLMRVALNVEAATAFEQLTLSGRDAELTWQAPQAWPNTFRASWLVPAPEIYQADRYRRQAMNLFDDLMRENNLDAIVGPSFSASLLLMTNFTGTPCAVIRTSMPRPTRPYGHTVWGRAFGEGVMTRIALEIERRLGAWKVRPRL
ncbi:MAG: amidase [Planctomycetota bacterium]